MKRNKYFTKLKKKKHETQSLRVNKSQYLEEEEVRHFWPARNPARATPYRSRGPETLETSPSTHLRI